jgi:hypothetical protein
VVRYNFICQIWNFIVPVDLLPRQSIMKYFECTRCCVLMDDNVCQKKVQKSFIISSLIIYFINKLGNMHIKVSCPVHNTKAYSGGVVVI